MKKKNVFYLSMLFLSASILFTESCKKDKDDSDVIVDADGNVYKTVVINSQVWMTENLKTTRYNDGTAILNYGTDNLGWQTNVTGAYSWYNNDIANKDIYGALYNWHTVNTDKLCPVGWHVPTLAEWTALVDYLGGVDYGGGKLKEEGTDHWMSPNAGATDEYGFKALPGGYRYYYGDFTLTGNQGFWWCDTEIDADYAQIEYISYEGTDIFHYGIYKNYGVSVRCLKD